MLKEYLTRQDYDEDQRHQLPPRMLAGERVPPMMVSGTHPAGMRYHYTRPWLSIIEALNIPLGSNIGVLGCGFGWDAEVVASMGYNVVGVETSPYVQSVKDTDYTTEYRAHISSYGLDPDSGAGAALLAEWTAKPRTEALILDADINSGQGRKAVRDAFGLSGNQKLDWAISSNVLPVLTDQEAIDLNDGMFSLATNVAHYTPVLMPNATQRPDFNWKSLAGWKALMSNNPPIMIRTIKPTPDGSRLTVEMT